MIIFSAERWKREAARFLELYFINSFYNIQVCYQKNDASSADAGT